MSFSIIQQILSTLIQLFLNWKYYINKITKKIAMGLRKNHKMHFDYTDYSEVIPIPTLNKSNVRNSYNFYKVLKYIAIITEKVIV